MRHLAALAVVTMLSLSARQAAADEEVFDFRVPDDDLATAPTRCAEQGACEEMKKLCTSWRAAGQHGIHGTNVVLMCAAVGLPIVDADLSLDEAAEVVKRCTSAPRGDYCEQVSPMCTRNRDEGWPMATIEVTCKDVAKVGAAWEQPPEVAVPQAWGNDETIENWVDTAQTVEVCNQGLPECAERKQACQEYLDAGNGYIYLSYRGHTCRAIGIGVGVPERDLVAVELVTVQTWCSRDPSGPACTSLQHICDIYGTDDQTNSYPNLLSACQTMASVHGSSGAKVAKGTAKPPAPPTPGTTDLWFGLAVGRVAEPALLDDTSTTIAADLEIHGLTGLKTVAPAILMRGAVGSTTSGGLLYDLALTCGVGLRIGGDGMLAVTAGGGLGGITGGRLGFAWQVPIDAYAAIPIGASLRVVLGARGAWLFKETARQDGATSAPIFDEVQARLGVAIRRPNGGLLGLYAFASEARETRILGLAVAYGQVQVETGAKK